MSVIAFIENLAANGVTLSVVDGQLKYRAENGTLDVRLKEEITGRRSEIIAFLDRETERDIACQNQEAAASDIYKEYCYPNGKVLRLTRMEFEKIVEVFRTLSTWSGEKAG